MMSNDRYMAHMDHFEQACEIMVETEQEKWLALPEIPVPYKAKTKCVLPKEPEE